MAAGPQTSTQDDSSTPWAHPQAGQVYLERCETYDQPRVDSCLRGWEPVFRATIRPGDSVTLKPNWLSQSHKYDENEWESVITHPNVITGVLKLVLRCLEGRGAVTIADGPQTDSSWAGIMARMTPDLWAEMGREAGVRVTVLDLRDHEWLLAGGKRDGAVVERRRLQGDPKGSTVVDLGQKSEFSNHQRSKLGYYGADYDKSETNAAHSNGHHKYKVSRTIVESDVFINIPKLKTHKKAGITCSLKNLVGINTFKNWLPHHNEGTPADGGDQFPQSSATQRTEAALLGRIKRQVGRYPWLGRVFSPARQLGKKLFGDTKDTVRSGNWYGNDTLWRMVLDLNKILLYANPDGDLRPNGAAQRKRYLSVVDGIMAGEGNGPEAPSPLAAGVLLMGTNPVETDVLCARFMGLDWQKIPSLRQAFEIRHLPLVDTAYRAIHVNSSDSDWTGPLVDVPDERCLAFRPHFGWVGHVERG